MLFPHLLIFYQLNRIKYNTKHKINILLYEKMKSSKWYLVNSVLVTKELTMYCSVFNVYNINSLFKTLCHVKSIKLN